MTAELLKNLIPALTGSQTQTASSSTAKAAKETNQNESFAGLLEDIKNKYEKTKNFETPNSKNSQNAQAKTDSKNANKTVDTSVKNESSETKKETQKTDDNAKSPETQKTDTVSDGISKCEDTTKTSQAEEQDSDETGEKSADNILPEFSANILNNLLLEDNENNTVQDAASETEPVLDTEKNIKISESSETFTDTKQIPSETETAANTMLKPATDKITAEINNSNITHSTSEKTQPIKLEAENTAAQEDIEILSDDNLVKVEDVIEQSGDEAAITDKNNTSETKSSKITQEVLDSLDVTVRTVEQPKEQSNSGQFSGKQSNAQEEIIKMSLENTKSTASASTETIDFTVPLSAKLPDTTNIEPLTHIPADKVNTTAQAAAQPKTLSGSEILTQINSKITLPQENASSKVNIILQPENLGKVSVEILHTKDGITAKMIAETPLVKEVLDKSIESLKNTLSSQGVNVGNITVKVEEANSAQNSNFGFDEEQFNREASQHSNQGENNSDNKNNSDNSDFAAYTANAETGIENSEITDSEEASNKHQGTVNVTV